MMTFKDFHFYSIDINVLEAFHKKTSVGLICLWVHNFDLGKEKWVYFIPMMFKKISRNLLFFVKKCLDFPKSWYRNKIKMYDVFYLRYDQR